MHHLTAVLPDQLVATTSVLAASSSNANAWQDTAIGEWIVALMMIVGGLVVVFGIFKSIGSFIKGEFGKGVKSILLTAVVAAFFLRPDLIGQLIDFLASLLEKLFDSGQDIGTPGGATTGGGASG
jgi:hypothetical protein